MNLDLNMVIQVAVTIAGYIGLLFMFERRMTRVETHLMHLLNVIPKRCGDEEDTRG